MKIYINNFNLNSLPIIQKSLPDILVETTHYTELYTNESIYHIDNKNIFLYGGSHGGFISCWLTVHEKFSKMFF
jgi:hypothetical protein